MWLKYVKLNVCQHTCNDSEDQTTQEYTKQNNRLVKIFKKVLTFSSETSVIIHQYSTQCLIPVLFQFECIPLDCFRSMAVNFCILYTPPTFTLLICLMSRTVVHPSNLISAISYFFVSLFTRSIEFSFRDPCWSLHSSRIFRVFAALLYFSSSFVSRTSVFVTFTINKNLALISLGSSVILDMRTHFYWCIQFFLLDRLKDVPPASLLLHSLLLFSHLSFFFEIHRLIGSLKSISFPNLRKTLIFLKFSEKDVICQRNGIFYHYLIFQNLPTENIIPAHFKQGIYFPWIIWP